MSPKHAAEVSLLDNNAAKILATGVIAAEVSPLNEIARYSVLAGVLTATGDSLWAASAYGSSTLALEGMAVLAAAPVLSNSRYANMADKVSQKIKNWGVSEATLSNTAVRAGVAMVGGSVITMGMDKIAQPEVTENQLRAKGLKVAAGLGLICTAEGYLISEGITHPAPETIGAAALAIGALIGVGKWVQAKIKQDQKGVYK
jgi:uncharacterized membrane protein